MKVAVAPEGRPDADRDTAELKLPDIVVVMEAVPELPAVTVNADGAEAIAKSAGVAAFTVKLIVTEWALPPPAPLTKTL